MAIALVANTDWSQNGVNPSSNINTTGATLLVMSIGQYIQGSNAAPTITDTFNNTWTLAIAQGVSGGGNQAELLYYVANAKVGANHNFTTSYVGGTGYPSQQVAAFSGVITASPLAQTTGFWAGSGASASTIQPGSLTPTTNGSLIISNAGNFVNTGTGANITVDSGLTVINHDRAVFAQNQGSALAYLVQTTASAINPTWTLSSTTNQFDYMTNMAVFQPQAIVGPGIALQGHGTWFAELTPVTSGAFNTTTGNPNLIVVCVDNNITGGGTVLPTLSDSMNNVWIEKEQVGTNISSAIFYCINPNLSTSHTFTVNGIGVAGGTFIAAACSVSWWSGAAGGVGPANSAQGFGPITTVQTGAVSPNINLAPLGGTLIIANLSSDTVAQNCTVNSSFIIIDSVQWVNVQNTGLTTAYLIQGSPASVNPTFTAPNSTNDMMATIASFYPGTAAPMLGGVF